ncbi:MAG: PspA-associated protein PspAA [Solirubrobacteraceae bacterium]
MIVRIATVGQFELDGRNARKLGELDQKAVEHCAAGDEEVFRTTFERMLALIRSHGRQLPEDELVPSDVILPPPDVSFEEARAGFSGEGLIPD